MRFALVHGVRTEASPGLRGACPHCPPGAANVMIARCGRFVTWHWAHQSRTHCDPWWEPETPWHRSWKALFPPDWQEVLQVDEASGERHVADVRTGSGLVIELQHSPLDRAEMLSREAFYQRLVWVVDGRRRPLDREHFHLALERPSAARPHVRTLRWFSRSKLLHAWREARAPVYLDFGHDALFRLVAFDARSRRGEVEEVDRAAFVAAHGGAPPPRAGLVVAEETAGWGAAAPGSSANRGRRR